MKEFLKSLIPPIFLKFLKPYPQKDEVSKVYTSYEEALQDCPKEGYETEEIVKVVVEKNRLFKQRVNKNPQFDLSALRTLIGVGLAKSKQSLCVLDFGGGGGYHYTIAKTAFGPALNLRWNVVETTAMAKEAQRISNHELKFFDTIEAARDDLGEIDLVFTSGALQCCPKPLSFLEKLLAINAPHFFMTRTSFNDTDEQIAHVQKSRLSDNGPGPLPAGFQDKWVYYPNVFTPKSQAEQLISKKYEVRLSITEDPAAYKVGDKEMAMYGYFCVLKPEE